MAAGAFGASLTMLVLATPGHAITKSVAFGGLVTEGGTLPGFEGSVAPGDRLHGTYRYEINAGPAPGRGFRQHTDRIARIQLEFESGDRVEIVPGPHGHGSIDVNAIGIENGSQLGHDIYSVAVHARSELATTRFNDTIMLASILTLVLRDHEGTIFDSLALPDPPDLSDIEETDLVLFVLAPDETSLSVMAQIDEIAIVSEARALDYLVLCAILMGLRRVKG